MPHAQTKGGGVWQTEPAAHLIVHLQNSQRSDIRPTTSCQKTYEKQRRSLWCIKCCTREKCQNKQRVIPERGMEQSLPSFVKKLRTTDVRSVCLLLRSCSSGVGRTSDEFVGVDGACWAGKYKQRANVGTIFAHGQSNTNHIKCKTIDGTASKRILTWRRSVWLFIKWKTRIIQQVTVCGPNVDWLFCFLFLNAKIIPSIKPFLLLEN